jgi:hypothetical protein
MKISFRRSGNFVDDLSVGKEFIIDACCCCCLRLIDRDDDKRRFFKLGDPWHRRFIGDKVIVVFVVILLIDMKMENEKRTNDRDRNERRKERRKKLIGKRRKMERLLD